MKRQAIVLVTIGSVFVMLLTACGGGSASTGGGQTSASAEGTSTASGSPYNVSPTMTSLQGAGWPVAQQTEGIPDTYTGVRQVGYLETSAPDGEIIDLQFFENPQDAERELNKTKKKESPFEGTSVGNVLVFDPQTDTAAVSQDNLDAVQKLLK